MAKKPLRIIAVGALKSPHWKSAATHYKERIQHWRQVQEIIVKDGDAALPIAERNLKEGQKILAALNTRDTIICLDEKGKNFTSRDFAKFLEEISENAIRPPCFIIGGAFGLDAAVRQKAQYCLALGPMTFPHELARVLLYEQLYRAECIVRNIPYHHD